jgi:hypothetical protein
VGEVYEVREETLSYRGNGPFPPASEVEARADRVERKVDLYRFEVLAAEGARLLRTKRRYVSSLQGPVDALAATPVDGKTYVIDEPFAACRVSVVDEDGPGPPAADPEAGYARMCLLRMAASLLPSHPVRKGESWKPGRDLTALEIPGEKAIRMKPRFVGVREAGGYRIARLEARTEVQIRSGLLVGAHTTMEEIVEIDLTARRFRSYGMETQWYLPRARSRPRGWRLVMADLVVERADD